MVCFAMHTCCQDKALAMPYEGKMEGKMQILELRLADRDTTSTRMISELRLSFERKTVRGVVFFFWSPVSYTFGVLKWQSKGHLNHRLGSSS